MAYLSGKRILITGLLSNRSIAYGIAKACQREGAELAFTYVGERFKDRITEFAKEFNSSLIFDCDVGSDEQIQALFKDLAKSWPQFDGFVHSIGFAPREAIAGDFLDGMSRESFRIAHDISAYSFPAMAKAALPYLSNKAALLTLSYLGAERIKVEQHFPFGLGFAVFFQRSTAPDSAFVFLVAPEVVVMVAVFRDQRDPLFRAPLATARTLPVSAVSMVTMRSASPSFVVRSTTASSRYRPAMRSSVNDTRGIRGVRGDAQASSTPPNRRSRCWYSPIAAARCSRRKSGQSTSVNTNSEYADSQSR